MRRGRAQRRWSLVLAVTALVAGGCARKDPPKRYSLTGQILAVAPERQQVTLKHADIPNFMPAMTMSYPVASPALLDGRTAGELVSATLEVQDSVGRLVDITHTGSAPLPANTNEAAMAAGVLLEGDLIPDAALIDQTDHRRSLSDWKGALTLVTFTYTSCPLPNFCPLLERHFTEIQNAIRSDGALKGRVKLITISFDPKTDTPAVLAAHAAGRHADPTIWTFLTGDPVTIDRLTGRFGVSVIREPGAADIGHSMRTLLISPEGRVLKTYPGSAWSADAILADVRAALRTS